MLLYAHYLIINLYIKLISLFYLLISVFRFKMTITISNIPHPSMKNEMDDITRIEGKSHKTDEEHALCRRKRDKIVLRYDPIVSKCYITIVFTRLVISDNEDALHVLRSLNHNTMVELLTRQQCVIVQYCCFEFEGGEYFATAVDGTMVSGESRTVDGK